ncbi:MAG TPA: DUF1592 domain-containing protein [Gemmataceae bacterium]|nr:DUF1592 domain-containing protein [Gemmataceae bacterium]
MDNAQARMSRWTRLPVTACCFALLAWTAATADRIEKPAAADLAGEYAARIRPLISQYCLKCHSTRKRKGDLDLERFTSLDPVRSDVRAWQTVLEMLETGAMPPRRGRQPQPEERRRLVAWVRGMLGAEAKARAGDPGRVVLRRLSNAEYNNTVRDLTAVDLQPARDFPVDGAAGEGFTNAGDALVLSPTLLGKYLNASKDIAAHAVLLPDGFRFSPSRMRRDWTDEVLAELHQFYGQFSGDGTLPLRPYVAAAVRHREEIAAGRVTLETVAAREKLNPKYFQILWQVLNDKKPLFPLDLVRARWRQAQPQDVDAILAEISTWQGLLWRFVPIGSYRYGNTVRQLANDPAVVESQTVRRQVKPAPGQNDVVLYLAARELTTGREKGYVLWQRPRFEGGGQPPLLLRDYARFGRQFELDYRALFADTARHLAAAVEAANDPKLGPEKLARKHGLDAALLKDWIDLLALEPPGKESAQPTAIGRRVPAVPLKLLDQRLPKKPAINGWVAAGADLPVLISNSSDQTEHVPGRVSPHKVAVHPTPTLVVAAAWKSPLQGRVRVRARIVHAHPACGNGVAWWLQHRWADRASVLAGGTLDVGKEAEVPAKELKVGKGDLVVLAIDPRDGNHACDLTEITLTVTEIAKHGRVWDLAHDVADTILEGNPHADSLGNRDVWRFVQGPVTAGAAVPQIPPDSVLARWRSAASDPKRRPELGKLAKQVQALLTGPRPVQEAHPNRVLYDALVSLDSPLLQGIDLARLAKARPQGSPRYGLDPARFGRNPLAKSAGAADVVVPATSVLEVRLPAALFWDREFVVEGKLDLAGPDSVVQFQVLTAPPRPDAPPDGKAPYVARAGSEAARQLTRGLDEFRRCFPSFICYARVIPDDEVICLKLFHREDEPLIRLFLDAASTKRLDRLWSDLRFISQFPLTEHKQLPLFIGFVTQDQPKELLAYFESQREPFRKRAEAFQKELEAAAPRQIQALIDFAALAYRRPLHSREKGELVRLYDTLRKKRLAHEEAFRTVLTRVLVSPAFLFRIEQAAPGKVAQPVSQWELATRLSYFLWATMPDAELRRAAAEGRLQDPQVLSAQVARMLTDPKVRGLAIEFATQWLHVRDIRENREKNEKLFPTFDDKLRLALFEESVRFCQDLFQGDRPLPEILDADHTFLNETLARHYGIPGVVGPEWRRVTGVKKYCRGGVLALGSVLTTQSGASRTSPVLRGNWLLETMLGEKLPKPPPNVPKLPEAETSGTETVRQMVEKHARVAQCAVCHQRMDPFGFALEKYDPIGRFRDKDLGGRPIDAKVRLKDGTRFDGIDGLRTYLLTRRKHDFQRHFCQKLLGYALGRSVALSDQPLLDEMLEALKNNGYRMSIAVQAIAKSKQFRYHRGLGATKDE